MDSLLPILTKLVGAALAPLRGFASPTERVFVGYLALAVVMAVAVWAVKLRGSVSLVRFLFPRAIWLHRSALLDYRLLFARALVDATLFAPLVVSSTAVAMGTLALLARTFGRGPFEGQSTAVVVAVLTVTTFVVEDFVRYATHVLLHRIPVLWEIHQVHHSAEVLTPFTVSRAHPLEAAFIRVSVSLAIGAAVGATSWMLVRGASPWVVAGVHGLSFAWAALGANLRHSHVWISFGPFVEHVFSSPAQHQVHHSVDARHHDRNFASALALWDWLFGTLYVTRGREPLVFGIERSLRNHDDTVWSMLTGPVRAIVRRIPLPIARPTSPSAEWPEPTVTPDVP
jgi:sterol desaturase/sphingolipid hydroxylase (fatty acid hydroxylase superfamily)